LKMARDKSGKVTDIEEWYGIVEFPRPTRHGIGHFRYRGKLWFAHFVIAIADT